MSSSAVLSTVHQRVGRVTFHRLPHVACPECIAGVPDPPRAAERDVLSADQTDQLPHAAQLLPYPGQIDVNQCQNTHDPNLRLVLPRATEREFDQVVLWAHFAAPSL